MQVAHHTPMSRTTLLLTLLACILAAQTGPLTDEQIVNLHNGGLTDGELFIRIASAPSTQFNLTPGWTDYMLKSGVSEGVIRAMAARENGAFAPPPPPPPSPPSLSVPVAPGIPISLPAPKTDGRTRIFVGETSEWYASSFNVARSAASYSSAVSATSNGAYGSASGRAYGGAFGMSREGVMKLTIPVMNQINQHCSGVVIVERPDLADLFVRLDQSTTMFGRHDDMAVFNRDGEMIFSTSTHSISKDAKRFCKSLAANQPVPKTQ